MVERRKGRKGRKGREGWECFRAGCRRLALVLASFSFFPAIPASPASSVLLAQSRDWSPRDRTILGDFTHITAVAASVDRVYAATPTALLIYNPQFRQWEAPDTPRDPTVLERVFAGLIDPLDNSLWLGRSDGWVHYTPESQLWERGFSPSPVQQIAFDADQPAAGLFLRTATGWLSVPRGGVAALPTTAPRRPIRPPTPADAIRSNPSLQANSASILLSGRLRAARYTSAAQAFGLPGWYLGTSGVGLLYVPDGAPLPERLSFGLPGDEIGALFGAPGGVWVLSQRTAAQDAALTFVASELKEFRWLEGPRATGFPFAKGRRLIGQQRSLWAATDAGLLKVDPESGDLDVYDEGVGLPDRQVLDVAVRRARMAVGTARGVVVFDDSMKLERLAPAFSDAIFAVAIDGDTVWVGTQVGLAVAVPDQANLLQPEDLKKSPAFQTQVVDIKWLGDTLVALSVNRMIWRDPGTGAWTLGPVLSAVGRLNGMVPYRGGFFVAGNRGFGFARLTSQIVRPIQTPGDLPGEVTSLAIDDDYLWVGTLRGLVRFRLDAIAP